MQTTKILAIPGSLRANSSSNAILEAIIKMSPANLRFSVYKELGSLPHFDDSSTSSSVVDDFRRQIKEADVVLICTPEYAFGVPGSLKNALDWTVGTGDLANKPVALVTASTGGEKAHAALLMILTALSATVIKNGTLLISFVRAKLNEKGEVKDEETKSLLNGLVINLNNDHSTFL